MKIDQKDPTIAERIRLVDWSKINYSNARAQAMFAKKFLENSARYASELDCHLKWPFFDIAAHISSQSSSDLFSAEKILDDSLDRFTRSLIESALSFEHLLEENMSLGLLDNPYDPIVSLFEIGGRISLRHGYVDLAVGGFYLGVVEDYLSSG